MALYVDLAMFRSLSVMPKADTDAIEIDNPGFIEARSELHQRWIEDRLRKRYAVPFADPPPAIVTLWLVAMLTPDAYFRRGFNPDLPELAPMTEAAARAVAEVKEAADSETGLFDLPLLDAGGTSAVSLGGPLGYTETSPYVWTDRERDQATSEDQVGRGT